MRPIDVNNDNAQRLWDKLYAQTLEEMHDFMPHQKFKPGSFVRIAKQKKHFEKSYLPNYTDEVFVVDKTKAGRPQSYRLKDLNNEDIKGNFIILNVYTFSLHISCIYGNICAIFIINFRGILQGRTLKDSTRQGQKADNQGCSKNPYKAK